MGSDAPSSSATEDDVTLTLSHTFLRFSKSQTYFTTMFSGATIENRKSRQRMHPNRSSELKNASLHILPYLQLLAKFSQLQRVRTQKYVRIYVITYQNKLVIILNLILRELTTTKSLLNYGLWNFLTTTHCSRLTGHLNNV